MSHFAHLPPASTEKHDVDAGSVSRTAVLIAAIFVVSALVAYGYFRLMGRLGSGPGARQQQAAGVRPDPSRQPPEPRLQRAPFDDIRSLRHDEGELLGETRWLDKAHGVVRIPIDEAMRLYVERAQAGRAADPFTLPVAPAPATLAAPAPLASPAPATGHP